MATHTEQQLAGDRQETEEEKQEKEHFLRILNAFKFYRTFSIRRVDQAIKHYHQLPEDHRQMIPNFPDHLDTVRTCVDHNYEIIKLILENTGDMFENKSPSELTGDQSQTQKQLLPTLADMDKVKTTLKQFVRDWSSAGQQEREQCYHPVIREITRLFPPDMCDPSTVFVLVPGAGLGRLTYELAKQGYSCQGNEWSLFMLFASNFVLNKCKDTEQYTLYPWIHQWTNNQSTSDQTNSITFPDVNPTDLPPQVNFSMAAGDFLEVYREAEMWDCLATVFFIDTAHNIIAYIETIWKILKPGGVWVNIGPLLYHYADIQDELSIELSYESVKSVIKQTGFVYEKEEMNVKTNYTQNPRSMLQYQYNSVFFVVRKPS